MDWWQLVLAVVTGGGLTAIVNAIANRHSVTADVYESISKSAATLAEASEKRINRLYERVQELEDREKTQIQEISSLRSEVAALRGEVSGKDAKIAAQAEEIEKLKAELALKEAEIEALRKRVFNLEAELRGRQEARGYASEGWE